MKQQSFLLRLNAASASPPISKLLIPSFTRPSLPLPKLSFSSHSFCNPSSLLRSAAAPSRLTCKLNSDNSDMISPLELQKPTEMQKPGKHVNGIFWMLLLNLGVFFADHVFQLVEEEEGNFGLWLSYILTGAGANLVSWLVLPRNAVSVGASGAVFGLFAVSVLVKMSWDWRKILEVLILGQFVIEKVMEAAQASTGVAGGFRGGIGLQNVNHLAHLSGALFGVALICLLRRLSSQPSDMNASSMQRRKD